MKILIPTSSYPLKAHSSWAPFVKEMALSVADKGHQVFVLVFSPDNKREEYIENQNPNVRIIAYNYLCIGKPMLHSSVGLVPSIKKSWLARLQFPFYLLSSAIEIIKVTKKYKIDIIHAQWYIPMGFIAGLLKPILKKPIAVTGLGADFHLKNTPITHSILRFTSKMADLNIACSNYLLNRVKEYGIDISSFEIIPNVVDFEKFKPKQRDADKKIRIGCAKRLVSEKNIQDLIFAVSELPQDQKKNLEVRIAGEGPTRKSLEELASSLHLQGLLKFIGTIPHNKVPEFLGDIDIYIDTSTQEGIATSNIEAMASGCVTITPDGYGNRDIIKHGENGFLYKAREVKEIVNILTELIKDPSRRQKVSLQARNTLKDKLDARIIGSRLKSLYAKII